MIGKRLGNLMQLLVNPLFEVIFSKMLYDEIADVASRPQFRRFFSEEDVLQFLAWAKSATQIELTSIPKRSRDPQDDYLLEMAIQAKALYLVSGDNDLLVLGEVEGCRILTIAQFEEEFSFLLKDKE